MKYNEEEILKQVIEYIKSTYNQHYSTDGKGLQAMDIFRNMDIDMDFSQANAIKYLMRYGKKQGRNEKDLYKAIHYIVQAESSVPVYLRKILLPGSVEPSAIVVV